MIKFIFHLFLDVFVLMEHPRITALRTLPPEKCTSVHTHTQIREILHQFQKVPRTPEAKLSLKNLFQNFEILGLRRDLNND